MSDDLDGAHSHQHILHNGESYIKLTDAAETCKRLRAWHTAVYNALTEWHDPPRDDETPKDALRRLIQYEITAALDPAVSQSAADLVATARREGMETALRLVRHYEAIAYQHGDLPYMDPHECAAQAAREIASSIEAIIYSSAKHEPFRRVCDQCGVSLPANCPADEGYGCPACTTHKEREEAAIRAAAKEEQ